MPRVRQDRDRVLRDTGCRTNNDADPEGSVEGVDPVSMEKIRRAVDRSQRVEGVIRRRQNHHRWDEIEDWIRDQEDNTPIQYSSEDESRDDKP